MSELTVFRIPAFVLVLFVAGSIANSARAEQPPPAVNAWGILDQVMQRFDEYVGAKALSSIHNDDMLTSSAISILLNRGGPVLTFQFYAPKPGFYRLFSQVQLGGTQKFAPFGIQVEP
jgi:hypothetical protein